MTPAQTTLYFRRWGQVVAAWRTLGLKADDNLRKELQRAAIGRDISSKQLNNKELDRVLFCFWHAAEPRNAPHYRAATASDLPKITRSHYVARRLARDLKPNITTDTAADNYILGTAANMLRIPRDTIRLADIDQHTFGKICAAFTYSLARQQRTLAQTTGIGLGTLSTVPTEQSEVPASEAGEPAYTGPEGEDPF